MLNLIGEVPAVSQVLAVPGAHLHLYGKSPRPGRKVGHVTIRAAAAGQVRERVEQVRALLPTPD
jgi:5-(carboxyamino)imidazole ribonucleotide synthase